MTRTKPESCQGCPCYSHGTDFSSPEGTGSLGVMVLAEASGESEQRDGLPLRPYAPAGSLYERALRRLTYSREQFITTNVLRCRPRNNWLDGAPWEREACNHCRVNLDATIAKFRPKVILALGGVALRELTGHAGKAQSITHLRGYPLPMANLVPDRCEDCAKQEKPDENCFLCAGTGLLGTTWKNQGSPIIVMPTYHPAFIRRGAAHLTGVFMRDIQRAVMIAQGRDRNFAIGEYERWQAGQSALRYQTRPTYDEAYSFYQYLSSNPTLPFAYDLETVETLSLDEDAREQFADTVIRTIQFSYEPGSGICLPWANGYRDLAARIMQLPNPKVGHNAWLFDLKVLAAVRDREGYNLVPQDLGHDTLQMFHHWQPDLPAHLQYAASFVQFPFPWKHLSDTALEFYGIADADATLRLYYEAQRTMRARGIWDGYVSSVYEVRPVLARIEDRGLPIDDAERLKLDEEFAKAQSELQAELDARFPDSARSVHPKQGYKKTPKDTQGLVLRSFDEAGIDEQGNPAVVRVERWCRLEPFSPNSAPQLLRYMKAKHHPTPKDKKKAEANGDAGETTAKKELQRLAAKTGDDFYLKVIECREFGKMRGTYIEGFKPGKDGRVHSTITFDTATWQLAAKNPNCFSGDTEALTTEGWKRFDLMKGHEIFAQFDPETELIDFSRPLEWIQQDGQSLIQIETEEQISICCTPDHDCLTRDRKTMKWSKRPAKSYPQDALQYCAGTYKGGTLSMSEAQLILIAALQADGHIRSDGYGYSFGFKKERKIERLLAALNVEGICYRVYLKSHGATEIYVPKKEIPEWWGIDKKYWYEWVLKLDAKSFRFLADEVWFWDGSAKVKSQYASSCYKNSDWVQIMAILSGRRAKIREYRYADHISYQVDAANKPYASTANHSIIPASNNATVYCVAMPKGTLIVRRNKKAVITGNCMNFPKHGRLAKITRKMVAAPPGHKIVEFDFKAFHVLTTGYFAESANYMRLARLDMHSFVAGHFAKCWDAEKLFEEPDDELKAKFKWFKSDPERKVIRDKKAKPSILGIGFGLGVRKLYDMNRESFSSESEARRVREIIEHLFPEVFKWQDRIRQQAHDQTYLRSPFGGIRWFYDVYQWSSKMHKWVGGDQSEQAIAYLPATAAFGHIRAALKELDARGYADRYQLVNNVHDAVTMIVREEDVDDCLRQCYDVLVAPSKVLVNKVAPGGLWCDVDGSVGTNWSDMTEVAIPKRLAVTV